MLKLVIAATAALLLCGCSTTTPEQKLATNQASCEAYGFKAGTDAYASCMMQRDFADERADDARRQRIANGLAVWNQPQPRPVTCNTRGNVRSNGYGAYGNSTTTCY